VTPTVTLTPTVVLSPTTTPALPQLDLSLSLTPTLVQPGDLVTTTLTLSNPGRLSLDNLVLSATLPVALSFEQGLAGDPVSPGYDPASQHLTWTIPRDLTTQAQWQVGFVSRVAAGTAPGSQRLSAAIVSPPAQGSAQAEAGLVIAAPASLATPEPPGPPAEISLGVEPIIERSQARAQAWLAVSVVDAEGRAVADGAEVELSVQGGQLDQNRLRSRQGLVTTRFKSAPGQTVVIRARVGQAEATLEWHEPAADALAEQQAVIEQVLGRAGARYGAEAEAIDQARHGLKLGGGRQSFALRGGPNQELRAENRSRTVVFQPEGLSFSRKLQESPGRPQRLGQQDLPRQTLGFELTGVQLGQQALLAGRPEVTAAGRWASYQWPGQPWQVVYEVGQETVAQYFVFEALPAEGDLVIEGRFETQLQPRFVSSEEGLRFEPRGARENDESLGYGPAVVRDAAGRSRLLEMELKNKQLRLTVPASWLAQARLPLVIDPLIGPAEQVAELQGDALQPSLAFDGSQYLTVWEWQGNLYGQRLDGSGHQVGDLIAISQADGSQVEPDVVYNPVSDEYLVVWTDRRYGSPYAAAYGRRVGTNGSLSGGEIVVSPPLYKLGTAGGVRVAAAGNGKYLVVWAHLPEGGSYDVFGQLIEADGDLSGSMLNISGTLSQPQREPDVAFDSQSETFLVVWADRRDGSEYDLYGRRLDDNSTLLGSSQRLYNSSGQNSRYPALAANGAGQFLAVWRQEVSGSDYDILGQRVEAATGCPAAAGSRSTQVAARTVTRR
jgi:hypothetical protein